MFSKVLMVLARVGFTTLNLNLVSSSALRAFAPSRFLKWGINSTYLTSSFTVFLSNYLYRTSIRHSMFQESRCFLFLSSRLKKMSTVSSASICFSILLRLFDIFLFCLDFWRWGWERFFLRCRPWLRVIDRLVSHKIFHCCRWLNSLSSIVLPPMKMLLPIRRGFLTFFTC